MRFWGSLEEILSPRDSPRVGRDVSRRHGLVKVGFSARNRLILVEISPDLRTGLSRRASFANCASFFPPLITTLGRKYRFSAALRCSSAPRASRSTTTLNRHFLPALDRHCKNVS